MVTEDHVSILKQGIREWNEWRAKNPLVKPILKDAELSGIDISGADLHGAQLSQANLCGTRLQGADLTQSYLFRANLSEADLARAKVSKANLSQADLSVTDLRDADLSESYIIRANLSGAHLDGANLKNAYLGHASLFRAYLTGADLSGASLFKADLGEADFSEAIFHESNLQEALLYKTLMRKCRMTNANLCYTTMIQADFEDASIENCSVYGTSVWDVNLRGTLQKDLDITPVNKSVITVDNLPVAQMICLLLHNEKVRREIESISLYAVLILGSFAGQRGAVLETLKTALRRKNYSPVAIEFQNTGVANMPETVKTLARLSRFVIADISTEKRIPQILDSIVHYLPTVPIQPILEEGRDEHKDYGHYKKFRWVLDLFHYKDAEDLAKRAETAVIKPAENKLIDVRKA